MFDLRPVFFVTGVLLSVLAVAMGLPAVVDAVHDDPDWLVFTAAAGVTLFLGLALALANRQGDRAEFSVRQIFLLTIAGWLAASLAAAMPFAFSRLHLTPVNALFEAVSGLTTTGATVIRHLDVAPPGILLWRGLLQWLGGMGFLVMAVAILPTLGIGGMQIFRLETMGQRMVPRVAAVAIGIIVVYSALTAVLTLLLWAAGMSRFPALVHALSTISCGGFSTSDASIGAWHDPAVDWVILAGMVMGGAPFVIYLQLARRRWKVAARNSQLRLYLNLMAAATLVIFFWLVIEQDAKPLPALRHAAFTVASVMTGTGFATLDWGTWSGVPIAVLFFLSFIGGCAGSTAGGMKIFRFQILYANARNQMIRLLQPHAVILQQYDGQPISDLVAESVLGFLFVYTFSFAVVSLALGFIGLDFWSAISAAVSALANLGPGLTAAVGPLAGYETLPEPAKWVLAASMLFGRLEMFIPLTLCARAFWRP